MSEFHKDGSEVQVGDLFKTGNRVHRVTKLCDYPGITKILPGRVARFAVCDTGFEITVIHGSPSLLWQAEAS